MSSINESELIINPDGSIYHLHLLPEQIADTVLLVGDPGRVNTIASYLDKIEVKVANREFITVTGTIGAKRISILATGIGTDNIDIVLNELDALVNIDFKLRTPKEQPKQLTLIRLGTSGALQEDIEVDSLVTATHGLGIDGLMRYYNCPGIIDEQLSDAFIHQTDWPAFLAKPYIVQGEKSLLDHFSRGTYSGITATSCGFYGLQGRQLRLAPTIPDIQQRLQKFRHDGLRILNFEMETSALYGLGKALGHNTLTICAIIANRIRQEFSEDYQKTVKRMIENVLGEISSL